MVGRAVPVSPIYYMRKTFIAITFILGFFIGSTTSYYWTIHNLSQVNSLFKFVYRQANACQEGEFECQNDLSLCEKRHGEFGL
jgi:hypothetical protein